MFSDAVKFLFTSLMLQTQQSNKQQTSTVFCYYSVDTYKMVRKSHVVLNWNWETQFSIMIIRNNLNYNSII